MTQMLLVLLVLTNGLARLSYYFARKDFEINDQDIFHKIKIYTMTITTNS
jgi:hypothetical protein